MLSKGVVYVAAFIGSIIGGFIPSLWGAGFLSFSSLIFSAVGAIAAIVLVFKFFR
jgi:uncharacterized membrane protein YeaQ/YmgE (transglycosylase-associated protein family)